MKLIDEALLPCASCPQPQNGRCNGCTFPGVAQEVTRESLLQEAIKDTAMVVVPIPLRDTESQLLFDIFDLVGKQYNLPAHRPAWRLLRERYLKLLPK